MVADFISLHNICRYYESGETVVKALDGVDLTIGKGEFIAIVGQSGSGKSTLMNILGCLDNPTDGEYFIDGENVARFDRDKLAELRRETFGFIFQRYNLLATSTASENVQIPAIYAGMDRQERRERADSLLADLNMVDRADHRPNQLSGGQQQRVAIARALMNNPPVILADEPTGALDTQSGQDVMTLLKDLNKQGRTIIIITHDNDLAAEAKRIIRIQDGRIIEDTGQDKAGTANYKKLHQTPETVIHTGTSTIGTFGESTTTAIKTLHGNLFRTALTLLGIVIGVAAVITMLAIGNGSKQRVLDQISSMGTNLLNIRPGAPGVRSSGDNASMTPDDAEAIADIDNILAVVPTRQGSATIRRSNIDYATSVTGVSETFPEARDWDITNGSFFTQKDVSEYAAVIVLGSTVADIFFPDGEDPVGQYIMVGNIPFLVIGVMDSKGAAPWGGDQDDTTYVPYTTAIVRLFGGNFLNSITVKVDNVDTIETTEAEIESLILARHGSENFSVRNTASFLEMATETQNTLTILLGAVAAISLLVGGIGVMNIMLVSVVERTREIGIRMATGARMRDILIQFNTESTIVCVIGGLLGVGLGLLSGYILTLFGVDVVFSAAPIILAFSCAVLTGIIFGYLPAKKAAKLDPVVALSSE